MFRALMAKYVMHESVVNLVAALLRSKGLQKCGHRLAMLTADSGWLTIHESATTQASARPPEKIADPIPESGR